MSHVFISYQRGSKDFADKLCAKVKTKFRRDVETWVDKERLAGGVYWQQEIDEAIRQAIAVIVIMTPAAKTSEYVTYEWSFALGAGVLVIPIMRETTELHPRLKTLHYEDFTMVGDDSGAWKKLLARIAKVHKSALSRAPTPIEETRPDTRSKLSAEVSDNIARLQALYTYMSKATSSPWQRLETLPVKLAWTNDVWKNQKTLIAQCLSDEEQGRVRVMYQSAEDVLLQLSHIEREQADHSQTVRHLQSQMSSMFVISSQETKFTITMNQLIKQLQSTIQKMLATGNPLEKTP